MGGISTSDVIYGNVKYTKAILDYGIPAILVSSSISIDLYFNVLVAGGGARRLTLTYHSRYLSATLTTPQCLRRRAWQLIRGTFLKLSKDHTLEY